MTSLEEWKKSALAAAADCRRAAEKLEGLVRRLEVDRVFVAPPVGTLPITACVNVAARHFGVTVEGMLGDRHKRPAYARHVLMYVLKTQSKQTSYPYIAKALGMDHTSVIAGCKKIEKYLMADDAEVARDVAALREKIGAKRQ